MTPKDSKKRAPEKERKSKKEKKHKMKAEVDDVIAVEAIPEAMVQLEEYDQLVAEKEDLQQRILRVAAEFDNYRKRVAKEKTLWEIAVYKRVLQDILAVYSSVNRGIESEDCSSEGLGAIREQIEAILSSHSVQSIAAKGEPFNPDLHEALFMEDNDSVPNRTVLDEIETGYTYEGGVIMPAKVKVSRMPAPPQKELPRELSDSEENTSDGESE